MLEFYRRNKKFKKDLPYYRFALKQWMWRGKKKKLTQSVAMRWNIVQALEEDIADWRASENFMTRFFIEPPEKQIVEVLSWN